MLTSLAIIFIVGYLLGTLFNRLHLPSLLGMLITGILIGPYALNLLDSQILMISSDLREIALIIILTRAGLALDLADLKLVGRPALLLCFVPALLEIGAIVLLAPLLFDISLLDAAIMGTVVAAVSPAVVVPRMLKLMKEGAGKKKRIPQMIMAGASVDDILVIILFFSFIKMAAGTDMSALRLWTLPLNIIIGAGIGWLVGFVLTILFQRIRMRDSVKVLVMLSVSFLLVALESAIQHVIPFSGLLAVMFAGIAILKRHPDLAERMSAKFSKLWVAAEIILFVLVGAAVDLSVVQSVGLAAVALIAVGLIFRTTGVAVSIMKTNLNRHERCFCMAAYLPKATVQAAIAAIPLSMGIQSGNIILSVGVLAIIISAPLGAILTDQLAKGLQRS